jgi:hypothetical protein
MCHFLEGRGLQTLLESIGTGCFPLIVNRAVKNFRIPDLLKIIECMAFPDNMSKAFLCGMSTPVLSSTSTVAQWI